MGSVRGSITREQWAGLGFGLFIAVPIFVKWQRGADPFAPAFGMSYPVQLAGAAVIGALMATLAYGERGKMLRALAFGVVSAPIFVVLVGVYMSMRDQVFHLELALISLGFFTPMVLLWKYLDSRCVPPADGGDGPEIEA